MRSGISSFEQKGWFNATLLKKNLTRFWPLWAVYGVVLFFALDMPILRLSTRTYVMATPAGANVSQLVPDLEALTERMGYMVWDAMVGSVFLSAVFGCLLAMALFSYLMNRRSVSMLHALPIKREGLFFTNWLSGLIFVTGPSLVAFAIALFAEVGKGVGFAEVEELLLWLLVNITVTMFFFDFALCCAMFTGQILALPVFYGILNILVLGVYYLFLEASHVLVNGISVSTRSPAAVQWFTPVYHLCDVLSDSDRIEMPDGSQVFSLRSGSFQAAAYAILVGAVLLLIAFFVYRARQMERAEDLVTVRWVQPIFRYGFGVCVGFTLGTLLYENYFSSFGAWGYILLVTLCAVIGGFVGLMFLRKTLRVLRPGWKGSLALGTCVLLLLCGIRLDVMGLQRYVPRPDQVAEVELAGPWSWPSDNAGYLRMDLTDPALIERVVELHRGVVDQLDRVEQAGAGAYNLVSTDYDTERFQVTYYLKDGRVIMREYGGVPIFKTELEDPDSWGSKLAAFMDDPEIQWKNYLPEITTAEKLDAMGGNLWIDREVERRLEYEEAQLLWAAIREDMDAGRYHRYLFRDEAYGANALEWEIYLDLYGTLGVGNGEMTTSTGVSIYVQRTATATMAAMEKLGYSETQEWKDGESERLVPSSTATETASTGKG